MLWLLGVLSGCGGEELEGFGTHEEEQGFILEYSDGSLGFWGVLSTRRVQCQDGPGWARVDNLVKKPGETKESCDYMEEILDIAQGIPGSSSASKDVITVIYDPGSDHQIFTGDGSELDSLVGMTTSDVTLIECYGETPEQMEEQRSIAVATFDAVSGDSVDMTFQSGLEGTVSFSLCN